MGMWKRSSHGCPSPDRLYCDPPRGRNVPSADDIWLEVVGTFADPDDDDDEGGPDRQWLQMEDLGHVSKSDVKKLPSLRTKMKRKRRQRTALARHKSVNYSRAPMRHGM